MNWLVKKLKVKVQFDENKLYASEILSILLQTEPANRKMFGELNAIDNLLQQVIPSHILYLFIFFLSK